MSNFIDNPDYWHNRAEQVRAQARDIYDMRWRHELLQIAASYDRIAEYARSNSEGSSRTESAAEFQSA